MEPPFDDVRAVDPSFNPTLDGTYVQLAQLMRQVAERFATDPSTAGISLAYLGAKGWYGSICRYTERLGQGKQVVLKAKRDSLEEVIAELEMQWRDYIILNGTDKPEDMPKGIIHASTMRTCPLPEFDMDANNPG